MGRGKLIGIILAVIVATGTGLFFLIGFLTYGTIQTSGSRFYTPISIRSPEPIVIRTDIGNINVRYNTSETQYVAKVDYDIRMGGNIDCSTWTVTTGNINIDYIDSLSTVGASFSGTTTTGTFNPTNSGGFEFPGVTLFRSLDYNSANYTFLFDLHTITGNINIDGQSS